MNFTILTPREVPTDAPQRIINEATLERRLTQPRVDRPRLDPSPLMHRAQRGPFIFCDPLQNEAHDVHSAIVSCGRRDATIKTLNGRSHSELPLTARRALRTSPVTRPSCMLGSAGRRWPPLPLARATQFECRQIDCDNRGMR